MKKFYSMLIRAFALPLISAAGALSDINYDELSRAVDKRIARAEAAVMKDYFAQHGLNEDEAEQAADSYREKRKAAAADNEVSAALRERAEKAEAAAEKARTSAEMLVQMARMGVPESCAEDVLLLTRAQLEKSEDRSSEAVREAVGAVIARLPGLAGGQLSSGSRGSFPRQDDGAAVWQHQLDRARASGDNAAAVSIIASAAKNGISLR